MPARRDGRYFVCAYPVFLGMWRSPKEVQVLQHDPNKDYFAELRQQIRERAQQNERSENSWERVAEQSPRRPEPPAAPAAD